MAVILFFMLATLAVLLVGLVFMAIGGKTNRKYSNKLMMARVIFQGLAVILLAVMFMAT